jgi:hypothetical protein
MPDWVTHIAVAWIICRLLSFKYEEFNAANTMLVITGALIPDFSKLILVFKFFGLDLSEYLSIIHIPTGSVIVAAMMSMLFPEKKKAFLFFGLGIFTHYSLDIILEHVSGGIYLLFPFSWWQWQLEITNSSDSLITLLTLCIAGLVYLIGREVDAKQKQQHENQDL